MSLTDKHPYYLRKLPDWDLMLDCYEGERRIKERGDVYLSPTSGMVVNGYPHTDSVGRKAYDAYRKRAVFHDFVREAVVGMTGLIHRKPPQITVPKQLDDMVKSATITGESVEQLWRRITEQQLLRGRCGMLVDVPTGLAIGDTVPYIALYTAPAIINWDVGQRRQGRQSLELVVLDESESERQTDLVWNFVRQIRILALSHVAADLGAQDQQVPGEGTYVVAVARPDDQGESANELSNTTFASPSIGGITLSRIPFVFVNVNDLVADPDLPPLLGLANLSIAIYRGEADYRQSLFMQGQDTLVRVGATAEQQVQTGVGAILDVPIGGSAEYIGVNSAGLSEQRSALENDKQLASRFAVQLLDTADGPASSGEALRVRVSAKTATLVSMQHAAAAAIRDVLVLAGEWLGLSQAELDSIEVVPNLDFSDAKVDANAVAALMTAKVAGLPLSKESIHCWLRDNEYTTMEFADEMEKILEEEADAATSGGAGGVNIDPYAPGAPAGDAQAGAGAKVEVKLPITGMMGAAGPGVGPGTPA